MSNNKEYEVIIVGGSYAGLAAAMALGRSMRKVLIIDSGNPCNAQTPHSHNFLTHDGETPAAISAKARLQVLTYDSIQWLDGRAVHGEKKSNGFEIITDTHEVFNAQKLIFATGLTDQIPEISGYKECWGISILHCPYCHGYEVRNQYTGVIGDGEVGVEMALMINHWANGLTLFTNGPSTLTDEQRARLDARNIDVVEKEFDRFEHFDGSIHRVVFKDGSNVDIKVLYARPAMMQHSNIPVELGCELTEMGLLKVDAFQQTTVPGVFACGDNSGMRALAMAISAGTMAGVCVNKDLIKEIQVTSH